MSLFDKHDIVEVIDGDIRYMLCHNPDMAAKEARTRQALLKKTTDELDKVIASVRKTKNSKAVRAGKIISKYNMSKFIIFEGADENLTYRLDLAKIEQESSLDGCYIVFTDVSKEDLTTIETVKTYKSLINVEQAFRSLKTTALEVRPVYHKTDNRIKCHVFICMLAYYIMWHMRQRLAPLCDIDGRGENRKYSFDFIIESLKSIRYETVKTLDVETNIITTPNNEQAHILKLLGVAV